MSQQVFNGVGSHGDARAIWNANALDAESRVTALELTSPESTKVSQLSDFPTPVSGVITLPADTSWNVAATIDLGANRIEMEPGTFLRGSTINSIILSTVQTGPLVSFGGADTGARLLGTISIINISGPAFEFVDYPNSIIAFVGFVTAANSGSVGTIRNVDKFTCNTALPIINCGQGLTIEGTVASEVRLNNLVAIDPNPSSFTALTIGPTFNTSVLIVDKMSVDLTDASVTGLDISDSATVDRAMISHGQFFGLGKPLADGAGKVTPATVGWKFDANQGIADSGASADLRFVTSTPVDLTITTTNEWTPLDELPMALTSSERFVANATGDGVIYKGLDAINIHVTAAISAELEGAGNDDFGITVFHNDETTEALPGMGTTNDDGHEMVTEINATQSKILSSSMNFCCIEYDDDLRVAVRNRTNGSDLEVLAASLTISKA